jgi:Calcineurin-like phosphoesterase
MAHAGWIVGAAALLAASAGTARAESYSWIQHVHAGIEARVLTTDNTCPSASIDGTAAIMVVHSEPGPDYPVRVCKVALPQGAKAVTVSGVPLPLPKDDPQRILLIGDTGCRMKGAKSQACNDPVAWPFRLVAEMAAHKKPDLIIHVGDYHYRETACPAGVGCSGSPFGDTWDVWRADFFAPVGSLLQAAPWIMTRGNHEECHRGGKGWSRTLEPTAFDVAKGCNSAMSPPFVVKLKDRSIAVMDVSSASEEKLDAVQAERFRAEFTAFSGLGPTWVSLHKPIWSAEELEGEKPVGDNKTLAAAALGHIPANVELLFSGHHHVFQVLNYDADLPTQIGAGHGGDWLDKGGPKDPAGFKINDVTIKSGMVVAKQFGFAMMEKQTAGWSLLNYDTYGKLMTRCMIEGRKASCSVAD